MKFRFRLGHLVAFNGFNLRINKELLNMLKDYDIDVEIDKLTDTVKVSTPIDLVLIKIDPYTNKAIVYRGPTYITCSIEDTVIDVENDAVHVVCRSNPIKRLLKQLKLR